MQIIYYSHEEKYKYSGYGLTFYRADSRSFDVIIFGVGNNSLSHAKNCKNRFLVLDEGSTFSINGSFGSAEKKFSINFSKANRSWICLSLHCNAHNSCLLVNGNKVVNFKADNEDVNFLTHVFLEVYL